jgi:hypothetical protein
LQQRRRRGRHRRRGGRIRGDHIPVPVDGNRGVCSCAMSRRSIASRALAIAGSPNGRS